MALTVRRSFSNEGRLYNVHQSDGDIVAFFEVSNEDTLNNITKKVPLLNKNWKWDHERSVVFGTVSNSGMVQIWDLNIRKALIKISTEKTSDASTHTLWANFLFNENGDPVLFVYTKDKGLCFKVLDGEHENLALQPVDKLVPHLGFCKPISFEGGLLVPDEKAGVIRIRFTEKPVSTEEINSNGIAISELVPKEGKYGMITMIKTLKKFVIVIYESGHLVIYDTKEGQAVEQYDTSQHFDRLSGDQPFPLVCEVSFDFSQIVVSFGGVDKPSLLLFHLKTTKGKTELVLEEIIEGIDGSFSMAMHPDKNDLIIMSGAGGKVEIMAFPAFQYLAPLPQQHYDIKEMMLYKRSTQSELIFLLCASEKNLTCWNVAALMRGSY